MGKDKQRTKGGVKPSRSDRTAQLLSKTQNVSFESQSVFANYVPVISFGCGDFDSYESTLSPELRLVLRKLSKKDATTKIKALGELSDLCTQNAETCTEILQYWPRIYSRLATDDSRKVRELSHGILEVVGKHVGRNLAPHLKSFAPYWFLSQSDIFDPAATSATNAFRAVFSTEKKQNEAISFCENEIFSLIIESLTSKPVAAGVKTGKTKKMDTEQHQQQEDSNNDGGVDFESCELRMIYSSLLSLRKLLELDIVDEEQCQTILDSDTFWALKKYPSSSVRRQFYDLIATIGNLKPNLIQQKCTKAITQSLREETSDCLPSLWNCFLALTLNCSVFTTDSNLAKTQLVKVCKQAFHGNARNLGPSVLPLVAKIGIDDDFTHQLLLALQEGCKTEKSLMEKSAILRVYAEVLAYYLSISASEASSSPLSSKLMEETVLPFMYTLITSGIARDFAKTLGALVKKDTFYSLLSDGLTKNDDLWNTKNCGSFIVSLCVEPKEVGKVKKSVKFFSDDASLSDDHVTNYVDLPEYKRVIIKNVSIKCLDSSSLDVFLVLSTSFQSEPFYNDVTESKPTTITETPAFMQSQDKEVKLSIILHLIKSFPTLPPFLGELSTLFEKDYNNIKDFKSFIAKVNDYQNIASVKRWLKQDLFCQKVNDLIEKLDDLGDQDSMMVLKFILQGSSIFGHELSGNISIAICSQLRLCESADDRFVSDVLRLVKGMIEKHCGENLNSILLALWERLVHFAITIRTPAELKEHIDYLIDEFNELIAKAPITRPEVYQVICDAVETVRSVDEINVLVKLTTFVIPAIEDVQFTPNFNLRFDKTKMEDLLNFLNLSYFNFSSSLANSPSISVDRNSNNGDDYYDSLKNDQLKLSFLSRTIFEGKLQVPSNNVEQVDDFVNPLLQVLYAQSVCLVWKEFELFSSSKTLLGDFTNELTILNSQWLDLLAGNKWKRWCEELLDHLLRPNREILLSSKLPLQIFLKSAKRMDLAINLIGRTKSLTQFIQDDSVSLENENVQKFLDTVIADYFMEDKVYDISTIVDYLRIQRQSYAQHFNFEKLFSLLDSSAKQIMLSIIEIVIRLLQRIAAQENEEDKEEFYSIATCWISAWLKQVKNLPPNLDKWFLLWVNKLATATTLVAFYARKTPKFAVEYTEFHAQQLYVPLYYLFLQLCDLKSTDFLSIRVMEVVGVSLTSIPSTTLAFIEPIPSRLCSKFIPLLEDERIAVKVAAYRILRKVKPKASTGQESDDLPIVPVELNDLINTYSEEISAKEITSLDEDKTVITYLLAWDALLTMHTERSSSEFANFVKEPHLLPHLLSILFFQLIPLVPEHSIKIFFDSLPIIKPDEIPPPMGHLVCSVLQKTLQSVPYIVRWWWNTEITKQRDKIMVEKFIVKYLSSKLTAEELGKVRWNDSSENITVHTHPGCNELVAHYKIEDTRVTLTISLPLNHPLGPVTIKISDKKLHGKLSNLLNIRSHSLATGLKMWKENLDEKFAHDECAICFFILHGSTKALPKLACKTCNHKFHSACLYKWFSTSNKSECPLCRHIF